MTLFNVKVRRVGTSLGILIPIEVVQQQEIKEGKEIEVSILEKDLRLIEESFGIDKGASKFERDIDEDRIEYWKKRKISFR